MHRWVVIGIGGVVFGFAGPAHADLPAPPVDDPAPLRLYDLIADEAATQHHRRVAAAGLTFGLSGLVAGGGIACFAVRPNPNDSFAWTAGGAGFEIIAGLGVIMGAVTLAVPTDMEKLAAAYKPIAQGTGADRLAWGEMRLEALAKAEKSRRTTSAIVSIALSPVVLGLGLTSAMLLPAGTDDAVRAGYASVVALLGFLDATVGVIRLMSLDPAERLLRTWRIGTGRPPEARFWAAPIRNGGTAGLTLTF